MRFDKTKNNLIILFLVILTIITRFGFLNWGNYFFFNPDENNMVSSISQMNLGNLNPNFFAYGQFPLFLTFFTRYSKNFNATALTLRFWSAFFSSVSIYFFYLICQNIFKSKKIGYLGALLLIFTPGLIQSAHFGTTESILFFVFLANIYFSLKFFQENQKKYLFYSILVSSIGLASKVTAIFFVLPIYLSLILVYLKEKKIFKFIYIVFIFSFLTLIISTILSPFNLIKFSNFISTISYESSVATGKIDVFYTRQFENTIPFIFQFQKIFPYSNGIFIFIFSFFGLFFFLKSKFKREWLILFIPSLIYFIYTAFLFVKWSRFMSPLFFIGPLFCLFPLKRIKNKPFLFLLTFLMIFPGVYFFRGYFVTDSRILASNWINENISKNSFILSESGNVINIPLKNNINLNIDNFDFYQLDFNQNSLNNLITSLLSADYILVPSRRVFKNQNYSKYPLSQKYYQNLFSGKLGFVEVFKISNSKDLFLDSEKAEETWSVFDNPTIRIYKKVKYLSLDDYQKIFSVNQ